MAYQSLTSQLQDFNQYAQKTEPTFQLVVRQDTELSEPLQKLVDAGKVALSRNVPPAP